MGSGIQNVRALDTAVEGFEALRWAVFDLMQASRRAHELVEESRELRRRVQVHAGNGWGVQPHTPAPTDAVMESGPRDGS